ncbi:MAG TPA: SH3 domain-containing protein [Labilithrix sp.]|nr:SH3 domain-containing protein [Labilithrix sp.]
MPKDAPLAVEVPASDRDKPGWVKVGVIAVVGFAVGIAWPRVLGVRLGPAAPGEASAVTAASASASAHGGRAPESPPASVSAKAAAVVAAAPAVSAAPVVSSTPPAAAASVAAPVGGPPNISVQKGSVLSCRTTDGQTKKGKDCGPVPGIDLLVSPRVRKIATCSGAEGQTGKLSLVVNADFNSGRLWYDIGKSSTVSNTDAIASCLKTSFHGVTATATAHTHPRYTIAYTAVFAPGVAAGSSNDETAAASADKSDKDRTDTSDKSARGAKEATEDKRPDKASAGSEATVAWEIALVRDVPRTGGLLARLPRGTKVKVGPTKDGWYQVKFGEGFASEGWVYRGAIGR